MMLALFITFYTGERAHKEDKRLYKEAKELGLDPHKYYGIHAHEHEALEHEHEEHIIKRHGIIRLMSILPVIGAIIAFILTENMRYPMIWADKWTGLMILIAAVQVVIAYLAIKKHYYIEECDCPDCAC